jgi:hypothetical protein
MNTIGNLTITIAINYNATRHVANDITIIMDYNVTIIITNHSFLRGSS